MGVIEKILEEIEEGAHTFEILGRDVDFVAIDWVRDVIRKSLNDAEYPYITEKDIEAVPPVNKEFLAECREAAKKYGKNDGLILVSERMPDNSYYCEVTFGDGRRGIAWYSDIIGMWLAKFK